MSFTVAVGLYSASEEVAVVSVFRDVQEVQRSDKAPIKLKVQNVLIESSKCVQIRGALYGAACAIFTH